MPQDNFGRIIPGAFATLPTAMKAECLALLAERAREAGDYRRLNLIEDRRHLYAGAYPYKLPDAQQAPAPDRVTRETAWNTSAYSYAEIQRINESARLAVQERWPHLDPTLPRARVLRLLAFIAGEYGPGSSLVYSYDLASAFDVAEPVLTMPLREAARLGFLVQNDAFSWFIVPPPGRAASRATGAPAGPRKGSDGRSALRPSGEGVGR